MKKNNKGFVGIDMTIAVIAVIWFSTLIVSAMNMNVIENVKLKQQALSMIYTTQIFEYVGITDFSDVTSENIEEYIINNVKPINRITINTEIIENLGENNIIKKVIATTSYEVEGKTYSITMERMKANEQKF